MHAYRLIHHPGTTPPAYLDDIGFNLISLFDGFVIVAAIDLGAPVWLVVLGAIAAVVLGAQLIERAKRREQALS